MERQKYRRSMSQKAPCFYSSMTLDFIYQHRKQSFSNHAAFHVKTGIGRVTAYFRKTL